MKITDLYTIYKENPIVCTDTRKIRKGSIFFALKGDQFNGNSFAKEAIEKGCCLAIIDEEENFTNNKFILVENVLETLQDLAKYHRKHLKIPVIGITGTNGKTTSKELIYSLLSSELNCYATKGNLNNHIGVPLSILEIDQKHDIAIIEMGANHEKEIEFLCSMTLPTHGVITNIGLAHLQGFKNLQGVITTKNELYKFIKKTNGLLFVNNDDNILVNLSQNINKINYGIKSKLNISINKNTSFLNIKWDKESIQSKLIGEYQLYNISLAICISNYFKISNKKIQLAIESYTPRNNRSEVIETSHNIIILDAYNANPSSMKSMLDSFAKQKDKNKLCILGDMLELGEASLEEHKSIIKLTKKLDLNCIFIGTEFYNTNTKAFKNRKEFEIYLLENRIKNKTILLKGSRRIGLEKLVEFL